MPSRSAVATRPALSNEPAPCEQAAAIREQTAAMDRQTETMRELVKTIQAEARKFEPAAKAIADLGAAQKRFCDFMVRNRMKLTTGLIGLLLGAGAISPTLATALQTFLAGFGK